MAKQEAGLKMTISIGFDTIKLISKRFTLNQFSIEEFFHNCQENGIYADKKLSTFTKDKDFIKYLKSKFADPYLYHDVNGLKLPAKSGSYFLNIDIDKIIHHEFVYAWLLFEQCEEMIEQVTVAYDHVERKLQNFLRFVCSSVTHNLA